MHTVLPNTPSFNSVASYTTPTKPGHPTWAIAPNAGAWLSFSDDDGNSWTRTVSGLSNTDHETINLLATTLVGGAVVARNA